VPSPPSVIMMKDSHCSPDLGIPSESENGERALASHRIQRCPGHADTRFGADRRERASGQLKGKNSNGLNVDDPTDQTRFAEVFLPHLVDAFRLARWVARCRAGAEDIVQEVSLRCFKSIRTFSAGSARSWVLTIVRNTSCSWLAKNRRLAVVLTEALDQRARELKDQAAGADNVPTPEAALITKMEADEVRKAVASLAFLLPCL
jgi:RNA polymerase sigma factor (sigma-70 family)